MSNTDNRTVPQLPRAIKKEVQVDEDANKQEETEAAAAAGLKKTEHHRRAEENANVSSPTPGLEPRQASFADDEPRQESTSKRPQGRGRIKRFTIKTNTPYIRHPETRNVNDMPKVRADMSVSSANHTQTPSGREKENFAASTQSPDIIITANRDFLHHDSPDPEPEPDTQSQKLDKERGKAKDQPPPLNLIDHSNPLPSPLKKAAENLPVSPPDKPPRPLHLAGDKRTTLYQVLMLINRTLATEMKKDPHVKEALDPEIQGPLRALGLLGRLVRLLFFSMAQHEKAIWRKRKIARAARRSSKQGPGSHGLTPPASPAPPFRGALAMFSVPVTQHPHLLSSPGPEKDYNNRSSAHRPSYVYLDPLWRGAMRNDDDEENLSVLEASIARDGPAVLHDPDEGSPVWQAMMQADRRYLATAKKRCYEESHSSDENGSSSSDAMSDDSSTGTGKGQYLRIASPSLPARTNTEDLFQQDDDMNPRRYETWTIPEQSKKEAAENKRQRREARAVVRQRRQAENDFVKQAQQEAEAAIRQKLDRLTDERDAALYLAETATYERDVLGGECTALRKDSEQLRRLMKALMDKECDFPAKCLAEEIEEAGKRETRETESNEGMGDVAISDESEERDKVTPLPQTPAGNLPTTYDLRHRPNRRPPPSPLPPPTPTVPRSPVPWTPTTPISEWDRRQIVSEARRVLRDGGPGAPPTTPAFPPDPAARRPISLAYRIDTIRAPLGYGLVMTTMDILWSLGLILWRQKSNIQDVARWLWHFLTSFRCFRWLAASSRLWKPRKRKSVAAASAVVRDATTLVLRSSNTQLGHPHLPHPLVVHKPFPRDAFAELVICIVVIVAALAALAAIVERNLWLTANGDDTSSDGEVQRRFMYAYVLRHRKDTETCEAYPRSIGFGPYHICGCIGTGIDLRLLLVPFAHLCVLAWQWLKRFGDMASAWAASILLKLLFSPL